MIERGKCMGSEVSPGGAVFYALTTFDYSDGLVVAVHPSRGSAERAAVVYAEESLGVRLPAGSSVEDAAAALAGGGFPEFGGVLEVTVHDDPSPLMATGVVDDFAGTVVRGFGSSPEDVVAALERDGALAAVVVADVSVRGRPDLT
jgi:hypothetical protein